MIFATGNEHKMEEIRMILEGLKEEIFSLKEAGIDVEIVEDGKSFEENAIIKAREIAKIKKEIIIADDSGLEVDYLDKEPGIYSARYMGEETSYHIKNQNIIERLVGVPKEKRTARFVCAIAAVFPDGEVLTTEGTIEGWIGYEETGGNGFGYDPIFMVDHYNKTLAQLTPEEKNEISHRGKALRKMKNELYGRIR